jgi:hypothetical protein
MKIEFVSSVYAMYLRIQYKLILLVITKSTSKSTDYKYKGKFLKPLKCVHESLVLMSVIILMKFGSLCNICLKVVRLIKIMFK